MILLYSNKKKISSYKKVKELYSQKRNIKTFYHKYVDFYDYDIFDRLDIEEFTIKSREWNEGKDFFQKLIFRSILGELGKEFLKEDIKNMGIHSNPNDWLWYDDDYYEAEYYYIEEFWQEKTLLFSSDLDYSFSEDDDYLMFILDGGFYSDNKLFEYEYKGVTSLKEKTKEIFIFTFIYLPIILSGLFLLIFIYIIGSKYGLFYPHSNTWTLLDIANSRYRISVDKSDFYSMIEHSRTMNIKKRPKYVNQGGIIAIFNYWFVLVFCIYGTLIAILKINHEFWCTNKWYPFTFNLDSPHWRSYFESIYVLWASDKDLSYAHPFAIWDGYELNYCINKDEEYWFEDPINIEGNGWGNIEPEWVSSQEYKFKVDFWTRVDSMVDMDEFWVEFHKEYYLEKLILYNSFVKKKKRDFKESKMYIYFSDLKNDLVNSFKDS